jgi:hypothetical protein
MLGVLIAHDPTVPPAATVAAAATAALPPTAAESQEAGPDAEYAPGLDPGARVLKAFSGQITEDWVVPGWCGPVQGVTSGGDYYAAVRDLTERLSARIERLRSLQQRASEVAEGPRFDGGGSLGGDSVDRGQEGGRRRRRGRRARVADGGSSAERFVLAQLELLVARRKAVSHHLLEQVRSAEEVWVLAERS